MLFGVLLIVAYANGAAIVSVKIVNEISVYVCVHLHVNISITFDS